MPPFANRNCRRQATIIFCYSCCCFCILELPPLKTISLLSGPRVITIFLVFDIAIIGPSPGPSSQPTTAEPWISPSVLPSKLTAQPSSTPSSKPSSGPSSQQSTVPSISPHRSPSLWTKPSWSPSSKPTSSSGPFLVGLVSTIYRVFDLAIRAIQPSASPIFAGPTSEPLLGPPLVLRVRPLRCLVYRQR